jgi:hypothetical protein
MRGAPSHSVQRANSLPGPMSSRSNTNTEWISFPQEAQFTYAEFRVPQELRPSLRQLNEQLSAGGGGQ